MQRVRVNGRRLTIRLIIAISLALLLVVLDQTSKVYLKSVYDKGEFVTATLIKGVLDIDYAQNSGAAWSFLADVSWAQTFFIVLTSVALVAFTALLIWSAAREKTFLTIIFAIIIAGAVGNFIDRLSYGFVVDFIHITLFKFPVFNIADSLMFVGIALLIIDLLFVDEGAVFKKKKNNDANA